MFHLKCFNEMFHFFTLLLEIPDKTKSHPWKFGKIVLDLLEIPRPKTETPGNATLYFLGHPWKFNFVFNELLETPYAISLISLEIPYLQPTLFGLFLE